MTPRLAPGWILALALALAGPAVGQATGPAPAVGGPPNLLVDGSFESEGPPAWAAESWRGTFRDYATERWDVRDGQRAAVIKVEGPADDAMLVQRVAVKPRTRYRLTGWAMATKVVPTEAGSTTGANLSLLGRSERSASLVGDSDWSLLGFEFETDREDQVRVAARVGHHNSTAQGEAWFDDLALIELGPSNRPAPRPPRTPSDPAPGVFRPPSGPSPSGPGAWPGPASVLAAGVSLLLVLLLLIAMARSIRKAWLAATAGFPPVAVPVAGSVGRRVDRVRVALMVALAMAGAAITALLGGRSIVVIAAFPAACALAGRWWSGQPALWGEAGGLTQSVPLATLMITESLNRPPPGLYGTLSQAIEAGAYLIVGSLIVGWAAGLVVEAGWWLATVDGPGPGDGGRA